MNPLQPLLDLISRRRGAGAGGGPIDWRLFWTSWENSHVGVRDRQRAGVHAPITLGRGFALDYLFQWEDGRISTGAAEKIGIADPEPFLDLARQAAYEDPDGANFAGPATVPATPLFSEEAAAEARSGGSALFAPLLAVAEGRAEAWEFGTWSGSISANATDRGVLTSRGFSASAISTQVSYSFWYEGRTGDGHTSRVPIAPAEAEPRIERACDLVRRLGTPEPSFEPGTMRVLLHPRVVESFLSTFLLANIHGDRIYHGQSAFHIEQFGSTEKVFDESFSMRLEPSLPMDPGSFVFTVEGIPARPLPYVEAGRLVSPILDLKYARRLGREPVPGPLSADSLRLSGSAPLSEDEAMSRAGRGVLVLSVLGLHTQDPSRGDFSVSAPQTLAISEGTLGGGVKAVLTGNFFEALRDPRLSFVSFEGFRTPGLLFTGSVGIDSEP
jgi:PmbA protein